MVDFKKKLASRELSKKTNPIEIYDTLDRASDKGPLRPAQEHVLNEWYESKNSEKDVIVKLHTGQGKTLIALLMLQSRLNSGKGPAVYVCPNIFLAEQTCEQAKQFGFKFCKIDDKNQIPSDFFDSKSILITYAHKIFNGFSIFRLGKNAEQIDSIVLDDSHACIDVIQNSFTIKIPKKQSAYSQLLALFENDLEVQGATKLEEIKNGDYDVSLPIPYWAWFEKSKEVIQILVKNKEIDEIKYSWPLIKDDITNCQCIISSTHVEIAPYFKAIDLFGTFQNATHRIFMSATTHNDAFFIKGLNVSPKTIKNPLTFQKEKWSGEKMILIPYLMHEDLTRTAIVNTFAQSNKKRKHGIVAITPSYKAASLWEKCGALVPKDNAALNDCIALLKNKKYEETIAIANRYDGIDLPDEMCRILIIDLKPYAQSLLDTYEEHCRSNSEIVDVKIAQKIEQGLGRGVRGEKDYCVIIFSSPDIINKVRNRKLKKYFSEQTNKQIEIGIEVAQMASDEAASGDGWETLRDLINQALDRDEGWKSYYIEQMNSIEENNGNKDILEILELEKKAEEFNYSSAHDKAINTIQQLIDKHIDSSNLSERGWYLQEIARYAYNISKSGSNDYQIEAHKLNRALLRPQSGMQIKKLNLNKTRLENIKEWISNFNSFEELNIKILELTSDLSFGVKSEKFESALSEIGKGLGFSSERPDYEWKEGPDNLWNINGKNFILFECKSEVLETREEINKHETGQMDNSCNWFKRNYSGDNFNGIMIIPTKNISKAGGLQPNVEIMRKPSLNRLTKNIKSFYNEFKGYDIHNLTDPQINQHLITHKLTEANIQNDYSEKPYQK